MEFQVVGALVGNIGIAAVLAWYLWYQTSVADPRRDSAQSATIEKLVESFRSDIQAMTTSFRSDMDVERGIRNGLAAGIKDLTYEIHQRPFVEYQLLMKTEKAAELFLANAKAAASDALSAADVAAKKVLDTAEKAAEAKIT